MCKEHPCPLSPHLGLWRILEVPDWDLAPWSWFGYGHWYLIHPFSKFWLSILILSRQRTSMSFKSRFGVLGFCILILFWIWSLTFHEAIFQILALYLGERWWKEHQSPSNPHMGLWRTQVFLTEVWHLDLDLDTVTCHKKPIFQILALYLDFAGAKNIHLL